MILFLHGLESGPKGKKSQYLQRHFPGTIVPDLDMSLWRPDKSNSVTRSALYVLYGQPFLIFSNWRLFVNRAVHQSLLNCARSALTTIEINKVQLLFGSSWGAAVAISLVEQGLWTGHTILLAPAIKKVIGAGLDENDINDVFPKWCANFISVVDSNCRSKMLVLHGEKDETIPLSDSEEFCHLTGAQLNVVKDGDHSLNRYLLQEGMLLSLITNALNTLGDSSRI